MPKLLACRRPFIYGAAGHTVFHCNHGYGNYSVTGITIRWEYESPRMRLIHGSIAWPRGTVRKLFHLINRDGLRVQLQLQLRALQGRCGRGIQSLECVDIGDGCVRQVHGEGLRRFAFVENDQQALACGLAGEDVVVIGDDNVFLHTKAQRGMSRRSFNRPCTCSINVLFLRSAAGLR